MSDYDVVVIGGGPGGYVAAIRCAQLGMKVACVDGQLNPQGEPSLGGTCLNVGCIPSKALLDSSEQFHKVGHKLADHGISVKQEKIDISKMMSRKDGIVKTLTTGIAGLLKKNKVDMKVGYGSLQANGVVNVKGHDGKAEIVTAKNIVIATGSVPSTLPFAKVDNDRIVDSTGALSFSEVPKKLAIIGAGVIGLELGSVWSRLGSKVTILDALDSLLPTADMSISREAAKLLKQQQLNIALGVTIESVKTAKKSVTLIYKDSKNTEKTLKVNNLLVATGRRPNTAQLNAEAAGLTLSPQGFIEVDEHMKTNLEGVYAIGDVVGGPMLAHKASEEGVAVAEHLAGQYAHVNYDVTPWVIYTWPEIAWVGKTSQQLKADGIKFKEGTFPFMACGRARAVGETSGMVKVISSAEDDTLLGVHIIGANASELIAEAVVAMEMCASAEDLARTIHAHPTLSEALHEAALAAGTGAIHI